MYITEMMFKFDLKQVCSSEIANNTINTFTFPFNNLADAFFYMTNKVHFFLIMTISDSLYIPYSCFFCMYNVHYVCILRVLLPALSCVQTCLLHLLDMSWEAEDLSLFLDIKLPDLLLTMSQENISVHDIAIRYET